MKRLRKAVFSVLLAGAMVCGMLTPAFAVWPGAQGQTQNLEARLYTIGGNMWWDDSACVWSPYSDTGTVTTVWSQDGFAWFTADGAQQYYGSAAPSYWSTATLDSSYSSLDGGMLWVQRNMYPQESWAGYWSNHSMETQQSILYHLPGSTVYWRYPVSYETYYEDVQLSSAAQNLVVHATSRSSNSGISGSGDLLFALTPGNQPYPMQNQTVWFSELDAYYDAAAASSPYGSMYAFMRDWMTSLQTPVSYNPNDGQMYWGEFETDPDDGETYLYTSYSPMNPTGMYYMPVEFLRFKAPCSGTVMLYTNFYAAANYYCALDLNDLYMSGYPAGSPRIVLNRNNQGYYPVCTSGRFADTNGDGVLDVTEAPGALGPYVEPTNTSLNPSAYTFRLEAGRVYTIPIFLWNEAQSTASAPVNDPAQNHILVDLSFDFTPDQADTMPFVCCPYEDGVAVVGVDPDYLFYNSVQNLLSANGYGMGAYYPMAIPYGDAYDRFTHTLTIPDEINGLPVRAVLDVADAPNPSTVYNSYDYRLQNTMTQAYMQQKYSLSYYDPQTQQYQSYPNISYTDLSVETLILPYTLRRVGDYVCGDTLQTVHVPQAAQLDDVDAFISCPDTLTICCDLPNSAVQQTLTAAGTQRNFTFTVCTGHTLHTHTFGSWTVTTPATHLAAGVETRVCDDCGAQETRATPVAPVGYGFFSGGYGTQSDPFLIATAADFDHIDDFYTVYGNVWPSNAVYFAQTADIAFYYNDANDNDGTSGYYQVDCFDPTNPAPDPDAHLCWARPTPVTEMHNAVYDGGGHSLQLIGATNGDPLYIVGDQYVGMFGLVTGSTICDLTVDLGYANGLVGTDSAPSVGGVIGRAENCTLDDITVYVNEYMTLGCDLLAGSAAGCTVTDCFINGACQAPSLIGGANSSYTCSNVWVVGEGACGMPDSALLDSVTGVILADGQGVSKNSVQQMLTAGCNGFVLVDTQGSVQQHPVQYDPDATGILFYFCPSETVTVEAGEHGSVTGAGVYQPYSQIFTVSYDAPKIITGLTPVPDTGYVFAGWEFTPPESENSQFTRTMTLQSDGSYTYTSDYFCGNVTVTANFVPHETHTFGAWVVTTPAAVGAAGVETRTCTVCHFEETRAIDPLTPQGTIRVSPGRAHPGGIARITVSVEDNPGLAAALLRVQYDPQILTLIDVENGVVFPSSTFQPGGDLGEVPFAVSWYDALTTTAYAGDGALVTFTFSVADDASAGTTPITVTYDTDSTFDPDENDVLFAVDDQPVTIGERMPGDTDGDGMLSVRDAAVLVRFLVGGWNVHVDLSNADVNGDGKLTLKDVVLIRRSLAGWNVTLR